MKNPTQQIRRLEAQIERVITDAFNKMKAFVSGLLARFLKAMRAMPRPFYWLYENSRLPTLQQQVTTAIDAYATFVDTVVASARQEAARVGSQAAASVTSGVHKLQGLGGLIAGKISNVLMLAVQGLSYTVDANLATLLDEPLWRATTLLRTEMYNAYRAALLVVFAAMPGVLGWRWQTAEDERVCPFCAKMDGTEHTFAERFESHPNCRCKPIPM